MLNIFKKKNPVPAQVVRLPLSSLQFASVGRKVAEVFTEFCQSEEGNPTTEEQLKKASSALSVSLTPLFHHQIHVYCGRFVFRGDDGVVRDTISLAFKPELVYGGKPLVFRVQHD